MCRLRSKQEIEAGNKQITTKMRTTNKADEGTEETEEKMVPTIKEVGIIIGNKVLGATWMETEGKTGMVIGMEKAEGMIGQEILIMRAVGIVIIKVKEIIDKEAIDSGIGVIKIMEKGVIAIITIGNKEEGKEITETIEDSREIIEKIEDSLGTEAIGVNGMVEIMGNKMTITIHIIDKTTISSKMII